jgi:hypothetical protein
LALIELFGRDVVARAGLLDLAISPESDIVLDGVAEPTAGAALPPPQPAAAVGADLSNASIEQLIWAANNHYEQAQRLLREGDWAGYGAEMEALKATLDRLVALTGGLPTATPPEN